MTPAQKPETLIQSQHFILTGPVEKVPWLLETWTIQAKFYGLTVTLTPTSVPDAKVGVTRESQQNPQQRFEALSESVARLLTVHDELLEEDGEALPGDLREAIEEMRAAFVLDRNKARVLAAYPDAQCHRWGSPPYPRVILWKFEAGTGGEVLGKGKTEAYAWSNARRLTDAHGSVTEQSQQKSRQDGE